MTPELFVTGLVTLVLGSIIGEAIYQAVARRRRPAAPPEAPPLRPLADRVPPRRRYLTTLVTLDGAVENIGPDELYWRYDDRVTYRRGDTFVEIPMHRIVRIIRVVVA